MQIKYFLPVFISITMKNKDNVIKTKTVKKRTKKGGKPFTKEQRDRFNILDKEMIKVFDLIIGKINQELDDNKADPTLTMKVMGFVNVPSVQSIQQSNSAQKKIEEEKKIRREKYFKYKEYLEKLRDNYVTLMKEINNFKDDLLSASSYKNIEEQLNNFIKILEKNQEINTNLNITSEDITSLKALLSDISIKKNIIKIQNSEIQDRIFALIDLEKNKIPEKLATLQSLRIVHDKKTMAINVLRKSLINITSKLKDLYDLNKAQIVAASKDDRNTKQRINIQIEDEKAQSDTLIRETQDKLDKISSLIIMLQGADAKIKNPGALKIARRFGDKIGEKVGNFSSRVQNIKASVFGKKQDVDETTLERLDNFDL